MKNHNTSLKRPQSFKNLTLLCVFLFSFFASTLTAQVGINTTAPDPSAMLDIQAADKGVLIPRVALTAVTTTMLDGTNTAATGLLIYNTNAAVTGGDGVGYYSFNGSAWDKMLTSGSVGVTDADFYEEGTTTAPDDITDDIFTQGNVAIGKNTADFPLEINTTTSNRTLHLINATTSGETSGIYNEISGNASNSSNQRGLYNSLSGNGNNRQYGVFNYMGGTGTGLKYAIHNVFDTASSSLLQVGVNTEIRHDGGGSRYGVRNIIEGISNSSMNGTYNVIENDGNGRINGVGNYVRGSGNGHRRGVYTELTGTGSGEHIGIYNLLSTTGTGQHYGVRNQINTSTGMPTYGLYNLMSGGSGSMYGVYSVVGAIGNAAHYGVYSRITGGGSGTKFGSYNLIPTTVGGTHYGVYSEALRSTGTTYAGYFLGNVGIGTSSGNIYTFPASRGTNGQIMQTDGSGNVSWVDPSAASTHRINDLIDGKSDNDGSDNGSSIFLGIGAGANDDGSNNQNVGVGYQALNSNTTGFFNTAQGSGTLQNSTTGFANTANGAFALGLNNIGDTNTATGVSALALNTSGSSNTASGVYSLRDNTIGGGNTAYGASSLQTNASGASNTAIGVSALFSNSTGSSNVALGSQAGYNELGSNKLYIENSNADADNALIYGEFDNDILRTNGTLQVGNPGGTGYAFPTVDGTSNQIMQTDGAGTTSWVNPNSLGLGDHDWYEEGTINAPNSITDDIFTQGNVGIGTTTTNYALDLTETDSQRALNISITGNLGGRSHGVYVHNENTSGGANFGMYTLASGSANGDKVGVFNEISNTGNSTHTGTRNTLSGTGSGIKTGTSNLIEGSANGTHYGTSNTLTSSGSARKYGSWNYIPSTAGGAHFGVYSYVDQGNGFAGYFRGVVAIGTESELSMTPDRYILPPSRGTNNQIMQTDGSGNVSWVDPTFTPNANNGLSVSGGDVILGGTLNQATTITQGNNNLTIDLTGTGDFQIDGNATNDILFADGGNNLIRFGDQAGNLSNNGTIVSGVTIDYVADFDNGGAGTTIGVGSAEYLTDAGSNRVMLFGTFLPATDNSFDIGSPTQRWDDVYATSGVVNTSDIRLKKNINALDYGLNEILQLTPISYQWKGKNNADTKLGFSAQELQQILPEVVKTHDIEISEETGAATIIENEVLGVYYSDIIPVVVKAIQEQQTEMTQLKNENETLKKKLEAQELRFQKIEKLLDEKN